MSLNPEQRFSAKARKQAAQGYIVDNDRLADLLRKHTDEGHTMTPINDVPGVEASLRDLANELRPKRRGLLAWVVDLIKGGR